MNVQSFLLDLNLFAKLPKLPKFLLEYNYIYIQTTHTKGTPNIYVCVCGVGSTDFTNLPTAMQI